MYVHIHLRIYIYIHIHVDLDADGASMFIRIYIPQWRLGFKNGLGT